MKADPSLPSRVRFVLLTTGFAPEGSTASLLRPTLNGQRRDIEGALSILNGVCATSQNKALAPAFGAFSELAPEMQSSLLGTIDVLDQSPTLQDLEKVIEDRLRMIAPRGKANVAREQLEGWWWSRVARSLTDTSTALISVLELEARIDDIREVLKRDALPIQIDEAELDDDQLEALDEMKFVQQLRVIRLGSARIDLAKRDFYRASTQRSRWTRENLLFDGEVGRFEKTLIEEWEPRFHSMRDKLGSKRESKDVQQAGQELYYWVEAEARFPFRNVLQRFLSVGSFNILANDLRVGWHRDFLKKLSKREQS